MRLHSIHGDGVSISFDGQTAYQVGEGYACRLVFSKDPLVPGGKFAFTVTDKGNVPRLSVGVTQTDPWDWEIRGGRQEEAVLRDVRDTWSVCLSTGATWRDQRESGPCKAWGSTFSRDSNHTLDTGHRISLHLLNDGSVTVVLNDKQFNKVFTDVFSKPLRKKCRESFIGSVDVMPLWVIIQMEVKEIKLCNNTGHQKLQKTLSPIMEGISDLSTEEAEDEMCDMENPRYCGRIFSSRHMRGARPSPNLPLQGTSHISSQPAVPAAEGVSDPGPSTIPTTPPNLPLSIPPTTIPTPGDSSIPPTHTVLPNPGVPLAGHLTVNIQSGRICWEHFQQVHVVPSTKEFFQEKKSGIQQDEIYITNKARKGKACIITLSDFGVSSLEKLPGYKTDKRKLMELWDGMGLDVYIPRSDPNRGLTATEIRMAVEGFSHSLTEDDQFCVLCILSHGGDGYIYGWDGRKISINDILHQLDNVNCSQMAGKPKIVVIQACQGDRRDEGHVLSGYDCASTSVPYHLPEISDMIICYPAMSGYVSYLHQTEGSIYVQEFVLTFSKEAGKSEIVSLLTKINYKVSGRTIGYGPGRDKIRSQMPSYKSCLRKHLFLFPCVLGKFGRDWVL